MFTYRGFNKKLEIIKRKCDYRNVYSQGISVADKYLVLYARTNFSNINRFGFSISKKVGKAVVRNRIRRLLKEICRLNPQFFNTGYEYVIIVRPEGAALDFKGAFSSLKFLAGKINKRIKQQSKGDNFCVVE
jgi:ribonuclease P protein component